MTTTQKRRSRYDLPDPAEAPPAPPARPPLPQGPTIVPVTTGAAWEDPAEAAAARRLLETARADVERVVGGEMRKLETALSAKAQNVATQLARTRAEIDRLEQETAAMRANRYDDVLKQLRERVNAL